MEREVLHIPQNPQYGNVFHCRLKTESSNIVIVAYNLCDYLIMMQSQNVQEQYSFGLFCGISKEQPCHKWLNFVETLENWTCTYSFTLTGVCPQIYNMTMIGQTVYHYCIVRSTFRCLKNSRISSHPTLKCHNENSHYIQRNKPADTTVRNLPNFDNTILRPTSYNIVIMWTPSYIQYRTFVPTNQRVVCSNSSYL